MNELEAEKQRILQQQERGRRDLGMHEKPSNLKMFNFFIKSLYKSFKGLIIAMKLSPRSNNQHT